MFYSIPAAVLDGFEEGEITVAGGSIVGMRNWKFRIALLIAVVFLFT